VQAPVVSLCCGWSPQSRATALCWWGRIRFFTCGQLRRPEGAKGRQLRRPASATGAQLCCMRSLKA